MDTVKLFCKIASSGQISVWEYSILVLIGGVFDTTELLQMCIKFGYTPLFKNVSLWMCVNILNMNPGK